MKWRKAEGEDGVVVGGGSCGEQDYRAGKPNTHHRPYTEQMKQPVLITVPKKQRATDCEKHRTISINSQITRIILRVIRE